MTQLRQRMVADMTVRGLADNTKKSYANSVSGLARYYRRSPDRISAKEVQDYLIFLHDKRGLTWQSCNCVRHGIRFFYRITLGLPDPHFYLPGAKTPSVLPELLNQDELVRLFDVTTNRKHRAMLITAYAAGLRASELGRLKIRDIDSQRMCLRIDQGKGSKDRYVPLSPRLLEELRDYWRRIRPETWLFPNQLLGQPMSRHGPARIYKRAKEKAGIDKPGGIHTLRHAYATGLLEAGVELHVIQRRLGHSSIRSTMRYLHLAHDKTSATPSPLDLLELPSPAKR
ncbi:tyrosine-type recombinase/integrase [Hoeflea sp.]|uniref:tyrosine-type recombinase/integrase n=1 Tax=Hoeflea sp. TaxID=1940281 RepID=UPI003B01C685